ncbi:MAG: hypothetical protein ACXAD7_09715 [Candidatus Kariarchaeaceae archaeon]|jgi:hypothetical protein
MSDKEFDAEELLKYLVDIAKQDGIMSDDEKNFIDVMSAEIKKYDDAFKKSMDDGEITQQEKLTLFQSRLKILRKALDTVLTDLDVTKDEHNLLDGLKTKLTELDSVEKKYMK